MDTAYPGSHKLFPDSRAVWACGILRHGIMKHAFCLIITSIICLITFLFAAKLSAQPTAAPVTYTLVEGCWLVDDCPICDRLAIRVPLRGTFQLRFLYQDPLFANYAVENLSLSAGETNGPHYTVVGNGAYRVGGEVALIQDLSLQVIIDD